MYSIIKYYKAFLCKAAQKEDNLKLLISYVMKLLVYFYQGSKKDLSINYNK